MPTISILSSSVRTGRNSHRVALFLKNYLEENKLATVHILDLNKYQFPLFEERLKFLKSPSEDVLEFADKIKFSDGIIIVTPEYNGSYPASLKNIIDLLKEEWYHKPIAISSVSMGNFGGSQVLQSLQFPLWKIGALTVPAFFPVPNVTEFFDESGHPLDKPATDKRAEKFIKELLWYMTANSRMNEY